MKESKSIFISVLILGILSMILASGFVSAASFLDAGSITQSVIDAYVRVGTPILNALFGGYGGWSGYLLFERFLIFILLLSVIFVSLGRVALFENQKGLRWLVAVIIPLIAMRFINYDQLSAIVMQYQVLAIVLSSVFPFIVFFFFVQSLGGSYPILRKLMWSFFIAIYAGLWVTTTSDIQGTIFFWTIAAALIVLIFDRRIEIYFESKEFAKRDKWSLNSKVADINDRINKINKQILDSTHPNPKEGRREMHDLTLQRKYLQRHI